jgi:hypothetical protein
MGLVLVMLMLLCGCYALCTALVLFAEDVISPRSLDPVNGADLPPAGSCQEPGSP